MYPTVLRIGSFEVSSFGVMVAIGVIAGLWLTRRELASRGLPLQAADAAVWAVVGGLVGAKILYAAEHAAEAPLATLLFSRGGMSWFGGFFGGATAGLVVIRRRGWPLVPVLAAAAPGVALGQSLGRIGCFLVGDDYGQPTDLPWGIAFPQGLPPTIERVHPTQLYEAALLALLAVVLVRWRRGGLRDRAVVGRYLLIAGFGRFLIEFIRVNEPVALGLSVAAWAAAAVALSGMVLLSFTGRRSSAA